MLSFGMLQIVRLCSTSAYEFDLTKKAGCYLQIESTDLRNAKTKLQILRKLLRDAYVVCEMQE